jgi:hypothetical protein
VPSSMLFEKRLLHSDRARSRKKNPER